MKTTSEFGGRMTPNPSKLFKPWTLVILPLWLGFLVSGLSGLSEKDVNLVLSSPIKEGDDLKMLCLFALPRNASIYTVKWYKGSREIFRYTPKTRPEKRTFALNPDMIVDETKSDMHTLILRGVRGYMTGNISCEVTPEPPHRMVTKIALLLVVVPPMHKPQLDISLGKFEHKLEVHGKLLANCTSAPSKPAVNLTFFINDNPVVSEELGVTVIVHPEVKGEGNLETRRAELELQLRKSHFLEGGKIRLKCVASLFQLYDTPSEEFSGELVRPKPETARNSFFGTKSGVGPPLDLDKLLLLFGSTLMVVLAVWA